MPSITNEDSGAFIEALHLPPTGDGPLAGLRFAVKDLIDVAGHRTGGGNPTWRASHPPAAVSAVCVEQLLSAGAECAGKTITDELAFSLIGENFHYGTPLNPAAPDRVPGGSSSGSASAVACGLVDFALGTDTGGSVRVPASNCGIWGWRPTHGVVSVAGVLPLSPTYDTVGILARSGDVLHRAAHVLLGCAPGPEASPQRIHLVAEALALADPAVRVALEVIIDRVKAATGEFYADSSLAEMCGNGSAAELTAWGDTYRYLMGAEAACCYESWIAEARPQFGPFAAAGFVFVRTIDRTKLQETISRREALCRQLRQAMGPRDLLCIPTTPTLAPLKGASQQNRNSNYYRRTLSMNAIAGVARLPQVSVPLANVESVPIGVSLIGAHGEDAFLLEVARSIRCED